MSPNSLPRCRSQLHLAIEWSVLLMLGTVGVVSAAAGVWVWGSDDDGPHTVPAGLRDVVAVSAGYGHGVALTRSGQPQAWGKTGSRRPVTAVNDWRDIMAVASGWEHVLGLHTNGTVIGWGDAGLTTAVNRRLTNIVSLAANGYRSLALTSSGEVLGWGNDVPPPDLPSCVAVAAGFWQSLALTADGRVFAWGEEQTPPPPPDLRDVVAVWAGFQVGAALKADGTMVTWGQLEDSVRDLTNPLDFAFVQRTWFAARPDGGLLAGNPVLSQGAGGPVAENISALAPGHQWVLGVAGEGAPWFGPTVTHRIVAEGSPVGIFSPATGEMPMTYRWQQDGVERPGATNAWLWLPQTFPSQTGRYSVVVSNVHGVATRDYEVEVVPFVLERHPRSRQVLLGHRTEIDVGVVGRDVSFRWQFEGRDLPDATNRVLTLESPTWEHSGRYRVVVTHARREETSREATLSVGTLASWDRYGQPHPEVPGGLPDIVGLIGRMEHGVAFARDGTVQAWGPLGLTVPSPATPRYGDVVAVAAGVSHNLVLRADGSLSGWGKRTSHELAFPVGPTRFVALAAGEYGAALSDDGRLSSWGFVPDFALPSPPRDTRTLVAVSVGYSHFLALTSDGRVLAWGNNDYGQSTVPTDLGPVVAVSAGWINSWALTADGRLVGWGAIGGEPMPTERGEVSTFRGTDAGACAVFTDGTAAMWGQEPTWARERVATLRNVADVIRVGSNVVAVARQGLPWFPPAVTRRRVFEGDATYLYAPATGAGGMAYRWQHDSADLPDETRPLLVLPSSRRDQSGTYTLVASNAFGQASQSFEIQVVPFAPHEPVLRTRGTLGADLTLESTVSGKDLGYQWFRGEAAMPDQTQPRLDLRRLTVGDAGTYSVKVRNASGTETSQTFELSIGTVAAWGRNERGQLEVPPEAQDVVSLAAGDRHALALTPQGMVLAWGANDAGQTSIPSGLDGVRAVAAGGRHSLALRIDGTVTGWGDNPHGQAEVTWPGTRVAAIAAGANHSLALGENGQVRCFGWPAFGLTNVPPFPLPVRAVAAGSYHNLALLDSGQVVAWGANASGQATVPTSVRNVVAVAAGGFHSLALAADGTVFAWGATNAGQTRVPPELTRAVTIAAGGDFSVAVDASGRVHAWGDGRFGQTTLPAGLLAPAQIVAGQSFGLALIQSTNGSRSESAKPTEAVPDRPLDPTTRSFSASPGYRLPGSEPLPPIPLAPGASGMVTCVDNPNIRYALYLPPAYSPSGRALPILFTFNPGGGGMMSDFRNVAAQLHILVVGVQEPRNLVEFPDYVEGLAAVTRDVRHRVRYDPTAVYAAGFSGGAWVSYDFAKFYRPFVAGVFAIGGWLGDQYGPTDRFLPGLLVVRAAGSSDPANNGRAPDLPYLERYGAVERVWRYPGGHVMPTDPVKRECLAWLVDQRTAAGLDDEREARTRADHWASDITQGQSSAVFRDCVKTILERPRTWDAHFAHLVLDALTASFESFRRLDLDGFASGPDATDFFYFRAIGDGRSAKRTRDYGAYYSALRACSHLTRPDLHRHDDIVGVMARHGIPLAIEGFEVANGRTRVSTTIHVPQADYEVVGADEPLGKDWSHVAPLIAERGGRANVELPASETAQRFLRLRATLPTVLGLPLNTTGATFGSASTPFVP